MVIIANKLILLMNEILNSNYFLLTEECARILTKGGVKDLDKQNKTSRNLPGGLADSD